MTTKTEVNVFLKCLRCGTFVTSSAFASVKKHFDLCQLRKGNSSTWSYLVENDAVLIDTHFDSFIDAQTEKITFTQSSLVLTRCNFEHYNSRGLKSDLLEVEESGSDTNNDNDEDWKLEAEDSKEKSLTKITRKRKRNGKPDLNSVKGSCTYESPGFPFKCDACTTRFKTEAGLILHKKNVHSQTTKSENVFSCCICGRMTDNRLCFQAHLKRHENAESAEQGFNLWKKWPAPPKKNKSKLITFNCKYCLKPHINHRTFLSHMKTDHPDKGEHFIFQCPYNCSDEAESIKQLIAHFKLNHAKEYSGILGEFIITAGGRRRQKCNDCGKFYDEDAIAGHKLRFHSANSIPKVEPKVTYTCVYPDCETKCRTVTLLKFHFIYHLQNNPYVCNFPGCKVKADAPSHLKRHIQCQHLEPLVDCKKCGVSYASRSLMKRHDCGLNLKKQKSGKFKLEQDKDSGWRLKPVTETSDASSSTGKNPVARISSTAAPYTKDKAEKYIMYLKGLAINSIIRYDPSFIQACKDSPGFGDLLFGGREFINDLQKFESKQKSFKCSKCPIVFRGRQGLKEHVKNCDGGGIPNGEMNGAMETPDGVQNGCPTCGKPFLGAELLEKHLTEEHSPDEIFKCSEPTCGIYFSSDINRERHFQHRHLKKAYKCEKCGTRYKAQDAYHKHLKQHRLDPNFRSGKSPPCEICESNIGWDS